MKLKPGPRKNEPMMTSTAQNIRKIVNSDDRELAVLGLVARVAVDVGREDQHEEAHAGDGHAGDHRVEHRQQLLQAEEVPRRLRRVRRAVDVGQLQQRGVDEDREDEARTRCMASAATNSTTQQVRPRVHLVDRRGLDVLDRAGLDDGEQALGVTAGAGADRQAGRGRRPRTHRRPALGDGAAAAAGLGVAAVAARPWPWRPGCARGGGRGSATRLGRPAARRRAGGRLGGGAAARRLAGVAPLAAAALARASSARLRRCSGISVMAYLALHSTYSGPEMPPSLRTRQKWMAMKMTMTNGSISTCSTYHRSSVSVPISTPPSSTKRTWLPNTGV